MPVDSPIDEQCLKAPPVVLDTTLYDLLSAEHPPGETFETICAIKPTSDRQLGGACPFSDKFIIHASQADDQATLAHMQLEINSHLLSFFVGPMNLIFLAAEGLTDDESLTRIVVEENANKSFSVIQPSQRPKVVTYANAEDCIINHDGSPIRWAFAADFAETLPHVLPPQTIYELNSKRWLAVTTSLRSANDKVLDCEIVCKSHSQNCHDGKERWYHGGADCRACINGMETETTRIVDELEKASLPFVLKLTQSLSSVGTMIVQDEDERKETIDTIKKYLTEYLPRITEGNAHLMTTSLIHSDFIPGETMALNFHVKRDGSFVFLGACHQLATGESGRQSTCITYSTQEQQEAKYRNILNDIARALHEKGYYGPVGADIMEDPSDGRLFAIDLNVRVPLSLLLYLLKTHLTSRGYDMSLVYECTVMNLSREAFEKAFQREFEEARIVLLGSVCVAENEKYAYGMVLAGENHDAIDELSRRILEFEV